MKYWGKVCGGICTRVFFVVVCLVEEGFVICAGGCTVDDSTTWKRNTEGNIVGQEVLSVAAAGNHVV